MIKLLQDWRKSLLEISKIPSSPAPLRHGVQWIPASSMAEQYYCELKVDHELRLGKVPTEAKEEGTVLHEQLLRMKRTTLESLVKHIEEDRLYAASFPLVATLGEVRLAGKPDVVIFQKGKPTFLVELKTTLGDPGICTVIRSSK